MLSFCAGSCTCTDVAEHRVAATFGVMRSSTQEGGHWDPREGKEAGLSGRAV